MKVRFPHEGSYNFDSDRTFYKIRLEGENIHFLHLSLSTYLNRVKSLNRLLNSRLGIRQNIKLVIVKYDKTEGQKSLSLFNIYLFYDCL